MLRPLRFTWAGIYARLGWRIAVPFFFQAEDSIRDFHVTGVQTCALPISLELVEEVEDDLSQRKVEVELDPAGVQVFHPVVHPARSEERRVGKECSAGRRPLRGN